MIEKHEFIGRTVEIYYNKRKFRGKIVDETKNMIYMETEDGIKGIIKKNCVMKINGKKINGKKITKRPEDRIKLC